MSTNGQQNDILLAEWESIVGKQVSTYFRSLGMSQVEVASKLGVTKGYINALFLGKSKFGKRVAKKFGDAFGFNPIWLMTGEGSMMWDSSKNPAGFVPSGGAAVPSCDISPAVGSSSNDELVRQLLNEIAAQRRQIQDLIDIIKKKEDV